MTETQTEATSRRREIERRQRAEDAAERAEQREHFRTVAEQLGRGQDHVNVFVTGPTGVRYARTFPTRPRARRFAEQAVAADCQVWTD